MIFAKRQAKNISYEWDFVEQQLLKWQFVQSIDEDFWALFNNFQDTFGPFIIILEG